nr:14723_t:CDS:1 [Entrophospora candida]
MDPASNGYPYTLTLTFSNIPSFIKENDDGTKQIAVCNWCKNEKNRSYPDLGVYSSEIRNVPMLNHIYFSPIHMNCSPARENQRSTQSSYSGIVFWTNWGFPERSLTPEPRLQLAQEKQSTH